MSNYNGFEPQSSTTSHTAARLARGSMLTSAKCMTAVAYADCLSQAGADWLRHVVGISLDFEDWDSLAAVRRVMWSGTPHLAIDDFAECLALVDTYHSFSPEWIVAVLWYIQECHPDWELEFRFAREFSPAIYIQEAHFQMFSREEVEWIREMLGASSASVTDGLETRFWFD